MSDLDLNQPLPDRAHDALRVAVLGAIDDLRLNVDDIQSGFQLTDMLFQFIGDLLGQVDALNIRADAAEIRENTAQAGIDAMQVDMAAVKARLAALEAFDVPPSQA